MDEGGWNTVQGAKNSRVLDPSKFLKITKVSITFKITTGPGQCGPVVGALSPNQKVEGSVSDQGTYLGCRFSPQSGHAQEAIE